MNLVDYLRRAVDNNASDVFIVAGACVSEKIDGKIRPIDDEICKADKTAALIKEIYDLADRSMNDFLEIGDDDFAFSIYGLARFRANTYKQRGSLATVIRIVDFKIPSWEELNIPKSVMDLADISSGMVLITGVAGSGKSTTEACLIDRINNTRRCHVVTLEDPIEFLHRDHLSIISQREISEDSKDYISALRACLRQAPDVIQLGEMRDWETMRIAMTAAETGHTIFATLHTNGAVNAINRVIDSFPANQQEQIRGQLSMVLKKVVSQKLMPSVDGTMIPAFEIMNVNSGIRNMIRDGKNHQIDNAIATGQNEGMVSIDQAIFELFKKGKISQQTALDYAENQEQMKRKMNSQYRVRNEDILI